MDKDNRKPDWFDRLMDMVYRDQEQDELKSDIV